MTPQTACSNICIFTKMKLFRYIYVQQEGYIDYLRVLEGRATKLQYWYFNILKIKVLSFASCSSYFLSQDKAFPSVLSGTSA